MKFARARTQPAVLQLIIYTPTNDVPKHLHLRCLAETPVKARLASILRLCKDFCQAMQQPCATKRRRNERATSAEQDVWKRSKRKDSERYLGRFVSRHAMPELGGLDGRLMVVDY